MNARITVLSSLALLCAPSVVSSLSSSAAPSTPGSSGWVSVAHAQDDQVTLLAREKFKEGVTAFQSGRFEEARALFLQAYALKRHPAVLLNLGQSELKAGYTEDGANHLNQFLREHKSATDQQKADAKSGLENAKKRTGQAIMIVDADGADVSIDGKKVGTAPLLDPYFVKPGPHEAGAAYQGKTTTTRFDAVRGKAVPVQLTLGVTGAGAGAVPVPTPTPSPAGPPPAPQPGAMPQPGYPPAGPLGPQPQPMGPGGGASFGTDTGDSGGRENFFDWFVDTPVAWVGAGLTGVGVIGGIAFAAAGGSASSSANSITDEIAAEQASSQPGDAGFVPNGSTPCGPEDDPSLDRGHYADACQQLRDNLSTRDLDYTLMGVFFGVGALAAAGTVIYYFVDSADGGDGTARVRVVPILSGQTQGFGLVGSF